MLASVLEVINNIYSAGWLSDRLKRLIMTIWFIIITAMAYHYFIINKQSNYPEKVINEGITLGRLALICNNALSNKCFASAGYIKGNNIKSITGSNYEDEKYLNVALHRIFYCETKFNPNIVKSEEICGDLASNDKYRNPLKIDKRMLSYSLQGNCGYLTLDDIKRSKLYNLLDYVARLEVNLNKFTYCYDDDFMIVLTQVVGHDSIKSDNLSRYGCESENCLYEVSMTHAEIKKIYK